MPPSDRTVPSAPRPPKTTNRDPVHAPATPWRAEGAPTVDMGDHAFRTPSNRAPVLTGIAPGAAPPQTSRCEPVHAEAAPKEGVFVDDIGDHVSLTGSYRPPPGSMVMPSPAMPPQTSMRLPVHTEMGKARTASGLPMICVQPEPGM